MIGHVWSSLIDASGHSALLVSISTVAIDRRVRSHRPVRPVSTFFTELAGNGWN
jgi:hypothetical protein